MVRIGTIYLKRIILISHAQDLQQQSESKFGSRRFGRLALVPIAVSMGEPESEFPAQTRIAVFFAVARPR
jgi:hypothetical protein